MNFLQWLQDRDISQWVALSDWGYPLLLSVHSIGMSAVVGILAMLNIRVLGIRQDIPLAALEKYMAVAWLGFGLNAISGALLFMSAATRLIGNWPFLVKMACVVIGGLLSWVLWQMIQVGPSNTPASSRSQVSADCTYAVSANARTVARISLVIWFITILSGRLIAYVLDHALLKGTA